MFRELCGDTTLENVVLVTNMWGAVSHDVSEAREKELSSNFFKPVLKKGAQMSRHHNTAESAHDIIRKITMKRRSVVLQIQQELVDDHKEIVDTAAGAAISRELNDQIKRHRDELAEVQKAMMRALERKDEETRKELEEDAAKLRGQMERIEKDSKEMASSYAAEKRRMEDKVKEMEREKWRAEAELVNLSRRLEEVSNVSARLEQELRRERERAGTELVDLNRRLQGVIDASAADQARLEEETREERRQAETKLDDLNRRLHDATNASAADRARLEQEVEREKWRAEDKLADLNRRLQDATSASAADQARLEQEIRKLQGHVATSVATPPRLTPYVRVPLRLASRDR